MPPFCSNACVFLGNSPEKSVWRYVTRDTMRFMPARYEVFNEKALLFKGGFFFCQADVRKGVCVSLPGGAVRNLCSISSSLRRVSRVPRFRLLCLGLRCFQRPAEPHFFRQIRTRITSATMLFSYPRVFTFFFAWLVAKFPFKVLSGPPKFAPHMSLLEVRVYCVLSFR